MVSVRPPEVCCVRPGLTPGLVGVWRAVTAWLHSVRGMYGVLPYIHTAEHAYSINYILQSVLGSPTFYASSDRSKVGFEVCVAFTSLDNAFFSTCL